MTHATGKRPDQRTTAPTIRIPSLVVNGKWAGLVSLQFASTASCVLINGAMR